MAMSFDLKKLSALLFGVPRVFFPKLALTGFESRYDVIIFKRAPHPSRSCIFFSSPHFSHFVYRPSSTPFPLVQTTSVASNTSMPLVHRTNYMGHEIHSSTARHDHEVNFNAIWTQFSTVRRRRSCCRGFGKRSVVVKTVDFTREHDDDWNLYLVNEQEGHNEKHYFYKFVLIPSGTPHYGKKRCTRELNWKWVGVVEADQALVDLMSLLQPYYNGDKSNKSYVERHHVHVGLKMEKIERARGR